MYRHVNALFTPPSPSLCFVLSNVCVPTFPIAPTVESSRREHEAPSRGPAPSCHAGYICKCTGSDTVASNDKQSCVACPDPCRGDPCSIEIPGGSRDNTCIPLPAPVGSVECGSYTCSCGTSEDKWVSTPNSKSCYECSNPCSPPRDPCGHNVDAKNVCQPLVSGNSLFRQGGGFAVYPEATGVPQASGVTAAAMADTIAKATAANAKGVADAARNAAMLASACGAYTCQCGGEGWAAVASGLSCTSK
jgi:hypothetical protein